MKNKKEQKQKRSKEEAEKYYYEKYYKDYDRKKSFFKKPFEIFAILIGVGLISFTVNSIKEFYNYSLNKDRLDQLIKNENKDLIFSKVCNDYILDIKNSGGKISDCDPEKILREDIEKSMFSFLLPDEYMQKKETKALNNTTVKKLSNETKPIKSNCIEGNCINGFGKKQYSNAHYIGEFQNEKENGQGTLVWNDGEKYVGEWKDGNRTGQGSLIFNSGAKYTGDFIKGKRTGKGTMNYSDGGKYTGDFLNGKRHGKGTLIWPSGNKYEGEFEENERSGEGTFVWKSGDKYIGEFFQGKRFGQGTHIWNEDNSIEVGKFDGDLVDGFVILPDGFKLRVFKKNGELVFNRVEGTNQNIDLLAQQLKRNNDLQTSRMLLDISKSLMGTNKNSSSLKLNNPNIGGGFLSGSSSSGMYKTCSYSSSLGTKTKTVFASAPCPMAY